MSLASCKHVRRLYQYGALFCAAKVLALRYNMAAAYLIRIAHFFNGKHFNAILDGVVCVTRFVTYLHYMAV